MVTGRELLSGLDATIGALRARVRDALEVADQAAADDARLRDAQLRTYAELADLRVDFLQGGGTASTLIAVHEQARDLLNQHKEFISAARQRLDEAAETAGRLEGRRQKLADDHEAATQTYDARVKEIEAALASDEAYQALAAAHEAATAVVSRAQEKLRLAEEDRRKKGEPYERDPLFSYLWERGYKTPKYRAWPLFRMLDGWVAQLCRYEKSYLNYQRLTELPIRLAEHEDRVSAHADETLAALEESEDRALEEGGAMALADKVAAIKTEIDACDTEIEAAEATYRRLADAQARALNEQDGPIVRARSIIEDSLKEASLPSLRVMAAETISLEDDHLVDALVQLRAEEAGAAAEARAATRRADRQREGLTAAEDLRRRIKKADLDSPYIVFRQGLISDILGRVETGSFSPSEAFNQLRRAARRSGPKTDGFGGRRRTRTMGVPDVLGDIMWEVAREAMRHGSGSGWGGYSAPRRRRTSVRMPRSSRSGGFKTGGGF